MKKQDPGFYSNVQPIYRWNEKPTGSWECDCDDGEDYLIQPAYRVNCPDCWARRP